MIKIKERGQTHPSGVEEQAERGKETALLHQQGGSDVPPHLLSTVSPGVVHSQSQSCLHSPPSWSSRAQLCPFPDQEKDGGVSQQSWTSQPAGMSEESGGPLKD